MIFDNFREISGALTVILSVLVYAPLIAQNAKGKLKSHPVTWAIVTLSGGTNAVILWFNHAGPGAWAPLFAAVCCLVLTIVSFFSYRKTDRITRRDIFFFCLGLAALILWLISRDLAALSVVLLTIANTFGFVPTFIKTWRQPRSESLYTWIIFQLMAIFGIVATAHFDFVNLFQRIANIIINGSVIWIMIARRRKPSRSVNKPAPKPHS